MVLYFISTGGYNNIRPVLGSSHWDLSNPPRNFFSNHIIFFSLCGTSYKKSSYKKEIPIDLEIISPLWWYTSWFYACFGYLPHFWIVWPFHFSEKVNSKQIQNQIQFPVYHGTAVYTTVPVSIMVQLYVYTLRPCTLEYNNSKAHGTKQVTKLEY